MVDRPGVVVIIIIIILKRTQFLAVVIWFLTFELLRVTRA